MTKVTIGYVHKQYLCFAWRDDQYKFMMEDYMQTKHGEDYVVPKRYLNVRVRENATDLEMLTLTAGLRAAI